ncbi:MAG TPA: hypothetical protein VFM14_05210 [Gemmatimonadales bacterium]|nr:hypothetical protein [Gemmatimonadales bacterium]
MRRSTVVTLLALVAFAAILLYTTLTSQRAECRVVVEFEGQRNSAVASGATEADAEREARTAACGPIARGMNASIACANTPPIEKQCRTL